MFNIILSIIDHIGDGSYGSNDPTKPTVSERKEVMVLRIRLQSYQVHLTMLQYYNIQYTVIHKIYIYTKMNFAQ